MRTKMEVKTTKGKTSKMEDKQNWKWKMTKMEITYMVDNLNDRWIMPTMIYPQVTNLDLVWLQLEYIIL